MKRNVAILVAILATSAVSVEAAVVCEFEPTLALDDCNSCYKADEGGIRLFVGGKLRASSTSPVRAPSLPVDGKILNMGVEKRLFSSRTQGTKFYEVCYEKTVPMGAGSFSLGMTEPDIEEFELGNPGRGVGKNFQYAVAGKVASGSASFFGTKLAFMPPPNWSGSTDIPYVILGEDGTKSSVGTITVYAAGRGQPQPLVVNYDPAEFERDLAAEEKLRQAAINEELRVEISVLEGELSVELSQREINLSQITDAEQQLKSMYLHLNHLQTEINRLSTLKALRQAESYLKSMAAGQASLPPTATVIDYSSASWLLQLITPLRDEGSAPQPVPAPRMHFVLVRRGDTRQIRTLEPLDSPDRRVRTRSAQIAATAPAELRRLTKREKKLAKKKRVQRKDGPGVIQALERLAG
jgi:hypothetical protein